ncbi:MAG: RodZ family helix-turn-helix domain-containing protein [Woeseiaceae bacterium]
MHDSARDGAASPVGGERLAQTRRTRGISVFEIAKELHIDEPKVRALEENRFDVLGAPVFAKGHMRKYAELVGAPVDEILADYNQLNRSAGAPPIVGPPRKERREIWIGPWVSGVVVILVGALAAWWWFSLGQTVERVIVQPATLAPFEADREIDPSERQNGPSKPQDDAAPDVDDSAPPPDDEATADLAEEPLVFAGEPAPEPQFGLVVAEQIASDGNVAVGSSVELVLSFTGDCWTEVTDATGRRLYYDLGIEGRSVTLNGAEPLGVLLGNSSNVSVRVNGFDHGIPAANRRGNMARLTIYGL